MRKIFPVILILCMTLSCSKKGTENVNSSGSDKILDTNFLNLGVPGTLESKGKIRPTGGYVHVLKDDQNIKFINKTGKIEISNFMYSLLRDEDIIVGNNKDRYLFKYLINENTDHGRGRDSIFITQASLSDITRQELGNIHLNFTPELDLSPSEARDFYKYKVSELSPLKFSSKKRLPSESNSETNPDKLNIINFKDYELINTNTPTSTLSKKFSKTKIRLSKQGDLKITIDEGKLELIPTFRGSYKFKKGKVFLETTFDSLIRYKFQITVETTGATKGQISFPLFNSIKFPIRIPGAVPLYVDLEIDFPAGIKIDNSLAGNFTFTVESEYALSAQSSYNPIDGKSFKSHYDYVINNRKLDSTDGNSSYQFELYFAPTIRTKIYRVLGPYAYISANMQADLQFPLQPSRKDLFVNFTGGVGVTFNEPLFDNTVVDIKSPALFKLSRGWDVIGPKAGGTSDNINIKDTAEMNIDSLDSEHRVALNLRPHHLGPLGKVQISRMPEFGKIVVGNNFDLDGLVYYYPPKVVEGRDSFDIQILDKGLLSKPSRIILNLSSDVKNKLKNKPLKIIARPEQESILTDTAHSLPSDLLNITHNNEGRTKPINIFRPIDEHWAISFYNEFEELITNTYYLQSYKQKNDNQYLRFLVQTNLNPVEHGNDIITQEILDLNHYLSKHPIKELGLVNFIKIYNFHLCSIKKYSYIRADIQIHHAPLYLNTCHNNKSLQEIINIITRKLDKDDFAKSLHELLEIHEFNFGD